MEIGLAHRLLTLLLLLGRLVSSSHGSGGSDALLVESFTIDKAGRIVSSVRSLVKVRSEPTNILSDGSTSFLRKPSGGSIHLLLEGEPGQSEWSARNLADVFPL